MLRQPRSRALAASATRASCACWPSCSPTSSNARSSSAAWSATASEADALSALLAALDARDSYTGSHSEAVVELAGRVAEELGLPDGDVAEVKQVAMLHDIGKIGVPDTVLGEPGELDAEGWAVMRRHSQIGADIVSSIDSLSHLAPAVRAACRASRRRSAPRGREQRDAGELEPAVRATEGGRSLT